MIRIGMVAAALVVVGATTAGAQQALVDRGSYLVNTIMTCNNCHTPIGPQGPDFSRALSGGLTFDEPPFKVTAPNITSDGNTGIGKWSPADIKKLMRTGVRPNGVPVAPVMPVSFYGIITENDMNAIVAYLRTVKAVKNKVADPVYKKQIPFHSFPGAEKPMPQASFKDPVKRGFYLATIGHCMECHTPFVNGRQDFANSLGKGGREFPGPWGKSVSRNITSDREAGLGDWTDAQIKDAITKGVHKDGSKLKPPMGFGYYAKMKDGDLNDVIAYLRTVPPKK
jgi:mono/diheme cytochrome c family protein